MMYANFWVRSCAVASLLLAASCSGGGGTHPASSTAAAGTPGAADTPSQENADAPSTAADPNCGNVALLGSAVTPALATGSMPSPSGGSFVDGVYDLVEHRVYEKASDSSAMRETLAISGNGTKAEWVIDAGKTKLHASGALTTNGASFNTTFACPASLVGKQEGGAFTVHGSEIWGFDGTGILVFKKR